MERFATLNDDKHCEFCNKSYKTSCGLDKHRYLCKLMTEIHNDDIYAFQDIPSQKTLYIMLLELGKKYKTLEDSFDSFKKNGNVSHKMKKTELTKLLAEKTAPEVSCFIKFFDLNFCPTSTDVENFLFDNKCTDFFNHILKRIDFTNAPIFCVGNQKNKFFGFINETWTELPKEDIFKILFRCVKFIFKPALVLKKLNAERIYKCNKTEKKFDNLIIKILDVDMYSEVTFAKYRNILFDNLKISEDC